MSKEHKSLKSMPSFESQSGIPLPRLAIQRRGRDPSGFDTLRCDPNPVSSKAQCCRADSAKSNEELRIDGAYLLNLLGLRKGKDHVKIRQRENVRSTVYPPCATHVWMGTTINDHLEQPHLVPVLCFNSSKLSTVLSKVDRKKVAGCDFVLQERSRLTCVFLA
jgi:hypothetical protein